MLSARTTHFPARNRNCAPLLNVCALCGTCAHIAAALIDSCRSYSNCLSHIHTHTHIHAPAATCRLRQTCRNARYWPFSLRDLTKRNAALIELVALCVVYAIGIVRYANKKKLTHEPLYWRHASPTNGLDRNIFAHFP